MRNMSKRPAWEAQREVRVKAEEEPSDRYGCSPDKRPLSQYIRFGLVVIDKVPGPTSHEVVAWVKKLMERIGYPVP